MNNVKPPTWRQLIEQHPAEARRLAYHEAGHAAMHWLFGDVFDRIDMRLTDDWSAAVHTHRIRPTPMIRAVAKRYPRLARAMGAKEIMIKLAGPCAEARVCDAASTWFDDMADDDLAYFDDPELYDRLTDAAGAFEAAQAVDGETGQRAFAFMRRVACWTDEAIDTPEVWAGVEALAARLLTVDYLEFDDALPIMAGAWPGGGPQPIVQLGPRWRRRFDVKLPATTIATEGTR